MTIQEDYIKKNRITRRWVVISSLIFGLLFWLIDSILDYFIYYAGEGTFADFLFLPPAHELYVRTTILVLFVFFGLAISFQLTRRKHAEEKILHMNNVLQTITKINQLIASEKDPKLMIKEVCRMLIETRGYNSVWIMIKEEDGDFLNIETAYDEDLKIFKEEFKRGNLPVCAQKALDTQETIITPEPVKECNGCQLARNYTKRGGFTRRLEYNGEFLGFISVSLLSVVLSDIDEQLLFKQLANDVSIIFHTLRQSNKRLLAEKELKSSEEKYKRLFDNLNAASANHEIILDLEGNPIDFKFLEVNSFYEEVTLLKAKDIIGRKGTEVIPNLEDKWIKVYGEVALKGESKTIIDHSDYLDKYWEVHVYSPKKYQFAVLLKDITEEKKHESELRKREAKFKNIVHSSAMGIYLYELLENNDLIFLEGNPAAEKHTGAKNDQFIGKTIEEAFPPLADTEVPERYKKAAKFGEPWYNEQISYDHNEITGAFEIYAFQVEQNKMAVMFSNITERKRNEQKLKESEEKLSTLFESMTEMVVLHELVYNDESEPVNYKILDCNQAFVDITGIPREYAVNAIATELYHTDEPPYFEKYKKVALSREPVHYTAYFDPMDKHFSISVVSPQKGQFATITTDITAIKQIEELISSKNEELENYLYVASHDLRSPLVNIQGFSQRLEEISKTCRNMVNELQLPEKTQTEFNKLFSEEIPRTLNFIYGGVDKMDKLINGLLRISRTGRMTMSIKRIDVNELMKDIIANLDFEIKESKAKIEFSSLPYCYGDYDLLYQLFINLISNSIKYRSSERSPNVSITGTQKYRNVVYKISDNGIGIENRHLKKIWDVFYQINPKKNVHGDGIGLSIVKRIVDKHRGKIKIESELGEGTTIILELKRELFTE